MLLKPPTILLFCLFIYSYSSNAQQSGKPRLELTGSINFALNEGYSLWGVGSHAKLLFPVGGKGNVLVTTLGFDKFYK